MSFETRVPGLALSQHVALLWHCEGYTAPNALERVLPSGTVQLLIPLTDEAVRAYDHRDIRRHQSFRGPLICGARSEFAVIDAASQRSIIGVQFKAGGAFPLLGFPVSEMHNQHLPLDAAWGKHADKLHHQLLQARSAEERLSLLEERLLEQLYRAGAPPAAITYALAAFDRAPHDLAIGKVCDTIGLSARRFIKLFGDHVGMTPKLYCRVRRFQEALDLIGREGTNVEWAQIALACGYFDQAHFNRDFRSFAGVNPTAYLSQRGEFQNHLEFSA